MPDESGAVTGSAWLPTGETPYRWFGPPDEAPDVTAGKAAATGLRKERAAGKK